MITSVYDTKPYDREHLGVRAERDGPFELEGTRLERGLARPRSRMRRRRAGWRCLDRDQPG